MSKYWVKEQNALVGLKEEIAVIGSKEEISPYEHISSVTMFTAVDRR